MFEPFRYAYLKGKGITPIHQWSNAKKKSLEKLSLCFLGKTFYQKWQEVSTYYEITLGKNKVRNQDTTYVTIVGTMEQDSRKCSKKTRISKMILEHNSIWFQNLTTNKFINYGFGARARDQKYKIWCSRNMCNSTTSKTIRFACLFTTRQAQGISN